MKRGKKNVWALLLAVVFFCVSAAPEAKAAPEAEATPGAEAVSGTGVEPDVWDPTFETVRGYGGAVYEKQTGYVVKCYNGSDGGQGFWYEAQNETGEERRFVLVNRRTQARRTAYCLGAGLGYFGHDYYGGTGAVGDLRAYLDDFLPGGYDGAAARGIRLATIFGYQDGKVTPVADTNTDDFWMATQVIIWEYQQGVRTDPYGRHDNDRVPADAFYNIIREKPAEKCYAWILDRIAYHTEVPDFARSINPNGTIPSADTAHTYTLTQVKAGGSYTATFTASHADVIGDLGAYDPSSSPIPYISVTRAGTTYTVTSTQAIDGTEPVVLRPLDTETAEDGIFFRTSDITNNQTMVSGALDDPSGFCMWVNTQAYVPRFFDLEVLKTSVGSGGENVHVAGKDFTVLWTSYYDGTTHPEQQTVTTDDSGRATLRLETGEGAGHLYDANIAVIELDCVHYDVTVTSFRNLSFLAAGWAYQTEAGGAWTEAASSAECIEKDYLGRANREFQYRILRLEDGDASASLTANNEVRTGSLHLRKTSETGAVAGFRFHMEGTDPWNRYIDRYETTDENGELDAIDLPVGRYRITEVLDEAQLSVWVQPQSQTVTVREGETAEISFANALRTGSLRLIKTFEGRETPLAGVPFLVVGQHDGVEVYRQTHTTDANGEILLDALPIGTYTVTELESEETRAYVLADAQTVEVTADACAELEIENRLRTGSLRLIKTFEGRETPLAGVPFLVVGQHDGVEVYRQTHATDANGEILLDALPNGTYTVTELESEETRAYVLADAQTVEVTADTCAELEIENRLRTGSLRLIKTFEGRETPLAGVPFLVVGQHDGVEVYRGTHDTDANGEILLDALPIGTYTVTELESEENRTYVLADAQTVEVTADACVELEIENKLAPHTGDRPLGATVPLAVWTGTAVLLTKRRLARRRKVEKS